MRSHGAEGEYASLLRDAMDAQELTLRNLEKLTSYSYEHIRKVVSGIPCGSRAFNREVCKLLGLNENDLWRIALSEKPRTRALALVIEEARRSAVSRHVGPSSDEDVPPPAQLGLAKRMDGDLSDGDIWKRLTRNEQLRLVRIADGWVAAREGGLGD